MAYINTGYQRATELTIRVKDNGTVVTTATLPLMSAFTQSGVTYPAVNSTQIAQMSLTDYNARVTAYAAYVTANYQSQYPGLSVSSTGARVQNLTSCPI